MPMMRMTESRDAEGAGMYQSLGAESEVERPPARIGRRLLLLAAGVILAGCGGGDGGSAARGDRPPVDSWPISIELQAELETWLAQHGRPPADYVVGLFANRDVVLLGEQHRIRHDVLFVQELLPHLHAAGVRVLATEFARRADQALIDSLVTAPEWREDLGREILFRHFMPWGFREYLDVFKAAWQVNAQRPAGTPPLRVLGMNNRLDYSQFRSEADWEDPEVMKRVAGGQTEADWAVPILAAVEQGHKVLVHCGIHHAFTGYRQPRVRAGAFTEYGGLRFGNHLRQALGEKAVTVYLHAPWSSGDGYGPPFVHPADGRLDAFMLAREGGPFAVGFDVGGSPLAGLPIEEAVYKHGHEPFTLAEFCDGWIYIKPLREYEPVTYIENWINPENVTRARANSMNARWRDYSVAEFNVGCGSYRDDFRRFFGHLR